MPAIKNVILVGHCAADSGTLSLLIAQTAPGVAVQRINDDASLQRASGADALLLVNRVLEGSFPDGDGVALIKRVNAGANAPAAMLISNYPDAQQAAQAAGALPGFGKSQAWEQPTLQMLRRVIAGA